MDSYLNIIFDLMDKAMFSPLLLIGLLITSLSLVINLKASNNQNIQKFRRHKNIYKFIDTIYITAISLLVLFFLSIIGKLISNISENIYYIKQIISILYISNLIYIAYTLFVIIYTLHIIVKTSLKNDI